VTSTGSISYFVDLELTSSEYTAEELPQQYKSNTHAIFTGSQSSYVKKELHQQYPKYRIARASNSDPVQQLDFGVLVWQATGNSNVIGNLFVTLDVSFSLP
jgi:hypothetical protein